MDVYIVFTEFRRGKTIENLELEPYTPSGNYPGHPVTDPALYHRVSCRRSLLAQ